MSYNDVRWAIDQQGLSSNAKWVLVVLADYKNTAHDKTWPKIETLMAQTALSNSSVRRSIIELVGVGLVKINPRNKGGTIRSNEYFLAVTENAGEGSQRTLYRRGTKKGTKKGTNKLRRAADGGF